jgi:hypothetical protein
VKRAAIACQFLGVIVDGVDQSTGWNAGLGVEDQIVPKLAKLLKVHPET